MQSHLKIIYISTARIPDVWAHSLQITKTCEALAKMGADVELVVPNRGKTKPGDPYAAMDVLPNFKIRKLWTLDLVALGIPFSFNLMAFMFLFSLLRYLRRAPSESVLYIRGELVIPVSYFYGSRFPVFWETHIKPSRMALYRRALKRLAGVVTITNYYRDELVHSYKIPGEKVVCVPDAVDLKSFEQMPTIQQARQRLGLPMDIKIALYTGSDIAWKGLSTLREAALKLPSNYQVIFVGNIVPDDKDPRKQYVGFKSRNEIPIWLAAADALVLTGTTASEISTRYTSPLKLFEYLAAGKPIVASDVPSFREVLDEKTAYFSEPDNAAALADTILRAMEDPEREERAERAQELSRHYSWEARAQQLKKFLGGLA